MRLSPRLPRRSTRAGQPRPAPFVDLRVGGRLLADARRHVEDFSDGEQAGFLICRSAATAQGEVLLAIEFHAVPTEEITGRGGDYALSWSPAFNARMIERASELDASLVILHSHGPRSTVQLSPDDRRNAAQLLPTMSRLLGGRTCATIVLGEGCVDGRTWIEGRPGPAVRRMVVVSDTVDWWYAGAIAQPAPPRQRHDRQARAITAARHDLVSRARVVVVGCSGGGSHVCQQLAHQGVGTIVPLDDELVEEVNLGRMVGSMPADVGRTCKVDVMERLITSIDPEIVCVPVPHRFPSAEALEAMKTADVLVCCVDSFLVREQLATFARRYLLTMIDIGIGIETTDGALVTADGQLLVTMPESPCPRCTPLLSDAVLAAEHAERPPGYDRNPLGGEPQVVSMNGTLASEACNSVLDVLTGYSGGSRGPGWWAYDGRRGTLERCELPPAWPACPSCAQLGQGDPPRTAQLEA
jgi:molybdopterin/thiamine biosynthesis adenylyltransferase